MSWNSRRSNALGLKQCVSSDNQVASSTGMNILNDCNKATAADAAISMAAALNVLQPATCGLGGDMWVLYYENATKKMHCLCGHGKTPLAFTHDNIARMGFDTKVPTHHPICISVPGAAAAMCDLHEKFGGGDLPLTSLFKPAVDLANNGFGVGETSSMIMREGLTSLRSEGFNLSSEFLIHGQAPKAGSIMRLPNLAATYTELGQYGKKAFYDGRVAKNVVDCVQKAGGFMTLEDLEAHASEWMQPIHTVYSSKKTKKPYKVWETPLSSQGVVVLEALNLLQSFDDNVFLSSDKYYSSLVDVLRQSFEDLSSGWRQSIPGQCPDAQRILGNTLKVSNNTKHDFHVHDSIPSDTTYLSVVDKHGNACSMVFSNYSWFGTSFVPDGCGFTLTNRARGFWEYMHRKFAPRARPFTTTIAGMITEPDDDSFLSAFGVMGGQNQPQAHLQAVLNLVEFGLSPQEAMDKERLRLEFDFATSNYKVFVEENMNRIGEGLKSLGHPVAPVVSGYPRNAFGRGQIITKGAWWDQIGRYGDCSNVYWGGSDPRGDGAALAI